jgi:hypothetical protein
LGGSADLFAQRLRLGEARGVETPLALASHATCSTWGDPLALASPFGRRPRCRRSYVANAALTPPYCLVFAPTLRVRR